MLNKKSSTKYNNSHKLKFNECEILDKVFGKITNLAKVPEEIVKTQSNLS